MECKVEVQSKKKQTKTKSKTALLSFSISNHLNCLATSQKSSSFCIKFVFGLSRNPFEETEVWCLVVVGFLVSVLFLFG